MATKKGRPKKVKLPPDVVELNKVAKEIGIDLEIPVETSTNQSAYFISLTFGDKVYEGSGVTLLDALKAVPVPVKIVSKGLLKVVCGEKKFEQSWQPVRLKKLFRPLSQAVQAKQLSFLLR